MSDIIDVALCTELLSNTCKIPDHSLLTVKMMNSYDHESDEINSHMKDVEAECNAPNHAHRKLYYFDRNNQDFLSSPSCNNAIESIMDRLISLNQHRKISKIFISISTTLCSKHYTKL